MHQLYVSFNSKSATEILNRINSERYIVLEKLPQVKVKKTKQNKVSGFQMPPETVPGY